ncbi:MAG: biotin/lipoyl-binding protein [Clostridia bacterium]|nr:biotin/lipoyl-binding protein [Clostridia bacterium]
MRNFFRRDKNNVNDTPEDFVLFSDNAEAEDVTGEIANVTDEGENIENTNSIDVRAVSAALEKENEKIESRKRMSNSAFIGFIASHRIFSVCVAAVLVLAIVAGGALSIVTLSNPLYGYAQVAASKENIMRTMETSGTLASGDKYEITSLVAGKIISCGYEVGDEVKQNDVLYKIDDTEAKLAVERAKNEVEKAKDAALNPEKTTARITATEAGVIHTLNIKTASMVTGGSQIGTVKKTDGTIVPIFAYMSGQVTVVSVRVGQSVSVGQLIATVNTKSGG